MRPQVVKFVGVCDDAIKTWQRFRFWDNCLIVFFSGQAVCAALQAYGDFDSRLQWLMGLLCCFQIAFTVFFMVPARRRTVRRIRAWQNLRRAAMQFDASPNPTAALCNWDQLEAAMNEF